jgi:hypothetical protein
MINAFWWGGGSNNRGIKWLAWDKLACPKEESGLGFRNFQSFNMAMVAKQGWNFMSNPTSLVARVYKARHETDVIASRAAVLLWFICQIRNNKVWNDDSSSAIQTGMQAIAYWNQWTSINGVLQDQHQLEQQLPPAISPLQWQQPAYGVMKCNVDASFFNANGATGWRWCLRDSRGQFKLAGTNIVYSPHSVVEGEALSLIEAMEEMIHRGQTYVTFESDSKLVVDAISSTHNGIYEFSILISHIQSLLRLHNLMLIILNIKQI